MRYFQVDPSQEKFNSLKKILLQHLDDTEARCKHLYLKKYDQERNWSISEHPEIESAIKKTVSLKKYILSEVEQCETSLSTSPFCALKSLIEFANELMEANFRSLFWEIFSGKLKKYGKSEIDHISNFIRISMSRENTLDSEKENNNSGSLLAR